MELQADSKLVFLCHGLYSFIRIIDDPETPL